MPVITLKIVIRMGNKSLNYSKIISKIFNIVEFHCILSHVILTNSMLDLLKLFDIGNQSLIGWNMIVSI